ncbi:hypothetical protein BU23DRAFT_595428 [Bimuria novae-zelandiae CBS 107.79]|uniref:Uncharacterized protein n=1 Tax=Bimuria novae-zelandiae CBS 107.79 TaxID=1447943 RepID=A0A6A5VT67_9PLEO|nr:hypothetical protein BU23DRAFT_595428 [Bimuria novae-zelandiae CBS 107.79]
MAAAICRARLLSDLSAQTPCDQEATSSVGRLCAFHSRQCQAMYQGYKKRNLELDDLAKNQPPFLANTKTSIVVQEFKDVEDEATLQNLHDYLFKRYILLDRVIKARKLHHSHFYAVDMDYGHEKYLTKLLNDKHVIARALERLSKRSAEVVHQKKEWLGWVKARQEEEESQRENESKKVKLEALLLKRYQKKLQHHQQEIKAKENKEREEEFLHTAYEQRLAGISKEEHDDWDPVQDVFGYERGNYVDLIKFFLMLQDQEVPATSKVDSMAAAGPSAGVPEPEEKTLSKSAKKRAKKADAQAKKLDGPLEQASDDKGSNTIDMETKAQMRDRLREPVRFERPIGFYTTSPVGPAGINAETKPIPEDELETLLEEVAEVKHLLFCRLLLSHAILLPIALRSDGIEDFLTNEDVTREHLRDLCLKLERPRLQDVRDACADFVRGEDGVADEPDTDELEEDDEESKKRKITDEYALKFKDKTRLPKKYQTKRGKAAKNAKIERMIWGKEVKDAIVGFDDVLEEADYKRKRTRIKVCGRYMYDYPSERALGRGGWYHFSVIAKDSSLFDAIKLCRNWNEFFELNILCLYHYFPAPKWTRFVGDIMRQQLLQLGFIPYFVGNHAEKVTRYFQTGSRGMARRSHQFTEMRNFICGSIKMDDAVSRRFIQYLSMETWNVRALVRDRKTGRVLIQPPEEELWLLREKAGWGRAIKNEFEVLLEVGPEFFKTVENARKWHFGFDEYYDVYIWDAAPGSSYFVLQRRLEEILARAIRVKDVKDMFKICAPIFETITMEKDTHRVRSIKPGEDVESMWDFFKANAQAFQYRPKNPQDMKKGLDPAFIYTEADAIEDAILFPEEGTGEMNDHVFRANPSTIEMFEKKPTANLRQFAQDLVSKKELSADDSLGSDDDYEGLEAVEDDGDKDWEEEGTELEKGPDSNDEYEFANPEDVENVLQTLENRFRSMTINTEDDPDYYLSIFKCPASTTYIPASIRNHPADLMAIMRLSMRRMKEYRTDDQAIEADLFCMIDREKSKIFKHCWHQGDLSHNALKKEIQWRGMVSVMDDFVMNSLNAGPFELCKFMGMAHQFTQEPRIVDDAFNAYAAVALFFDTEAFLDSETGEIFKGSKFIDQAERAKDVPDRRTHRSNKTMPTFFWAEWDRLLKDNNRGIGDEISIYPLEWRKAMRSAIIRLFKAGIIGNSYCGESDGVAIAAAEPNRPLDLYIDYRVGMPDPSVISHLTDPTPLDRAYLLDKAHAFLEEHPNACFSALRMWSAPHFYPLMLGIDNRKMVSFLDDRERLWEFRFIPKDMPYSEWSVHLQLSQRIKPYRKVLTEEKVIVAKDLILVMGKDKAECRRLSEGVTWAVTTRPWRLEIDFWRSFVGVDFEFLEGLDEKWLE